jgi:peptidoglycan/xylan/chitin deacetylase (PgdA/CDA1 family)
MLAAVNFHYIRNSFKTPYPGIYGQTPEQFETQLKTLGSIGNFVSAEDIKLHIQGQKELPQKSILITFDDGLKEQFELALPILDKLGIPAVFYANTKPYTESKILNVHKIHILRTQVSPDQFKTFIQTQLSEEGIEIDQNDFLSKANKSYRYDTKEQSQIKYLLNFVLSFKVKEKIINNIFKKIFEENEPDMCEELYFTKEQMMRLADRGFLGCHSHSHYPIGLLSDKEKFEEISQSKSILEQITGQPISAFSFPFGSPEACLNSTEVLQKCGIKFAFTMERAINSHFENPFYLSRFDTNDVPGGKFYKHKPEDFFKSIPHLKES